MGRLRGGFHRRFHPHKWYLRESQPQVMQGHSRSRVTGHHDQLGLSIQQEAGDAKGKFADLIPGPGAIGHMRLVAQVEQSLRGQLAPDRPQDRKPAHAGIKNANWLG